MVARRSRYSRRGEWPLQHAIGRSARASSRRRGTITWGAPAVHCDLGGGATPARCGDRPVSSRSGRRRRRWIVLASVKPTPRGRNHSVGHGELRACGRLPAPSVARFTRATRHVAVPPGIGGLDPACNKRAAAAAQRPARSGVAAGDIRGASAGQVIARRCPRRATGRRCSPGQLLCLPVPVVAATLPDGTTPRLHPGLAPPDPASRRGGSALP